MSNNLYKKKEQAISQKSKIIYFIVLGMLILSFIIIWIDIFTTSTHLHHQLDTMVEGKDYFIEEVTITKKDFDSYYSTETSSVETTNYYFYYDHSMKKKLYVDEATYKTYTVGDKIPAYTTDHSTYGFKKEAILPHTQYTTNELKKAIGVILGAVILLFTLGIWAKFK